MLVDALHHAREHLTTEQALALLRWLTRDYGTDETVTRLVDTREVFIIFALNPDGMRYDLTGAPYRAWRKNRQRDAAGNAHVHRPQPQLRLPLGMLPRVVGQAELRHLPRPGTVLGARDAGPPRLRQQPRGGRRPADPDPRHAPHQRAADPVAVRLHEDQRPVRHDARSTTRPSCRWAARWRPATATSPSSRRTSTSPTATRSTGCTAGTGSSRTPTSCSRPRRPPSGATTTPTIRRSPPRPSATGGRSSTSSTAPPARTPTWAAATRPPTAGRCSTTSRSTAAGSATPPARTPRPSGRWAVAQPPAHVVGRGQAARDDGRPGIRALVTGAAAGSSAGANDVDGGTTTIRSRAIRLPADPAAYGNLTFSWTFAHSAASSQGRRAPGPRRGRGRDPDRRLRGPGAAGERNGSWRDGDASRSRRGPARRSASCSRRSTAGRGNLVEAAVDDVRIRRP